MSESTQSPYALHQTTKSFCTGCNQPVHLLCTDQTDANQPSFFICFPCGTIGHVGVGPVRKIVNKGDSHVCLDK